MSAEFRLGTRGSPLALAQTGLVAERIRQEFPDLNVSIVVIKTTGDRDHRTPLAQMGGQGVFVKELEEALSRGVIDAAVHSCKDVPHTLPADMELVAFLPREDPCDVLLSEHRTLATLAPGARVGTGSPRRVSQLHMLRPDLVYVELRGNLDTRIQRLSNDLDAIVLANAGLRRLGRSASVMEHLDMAQIVPAVAQGAVAMEIHRDSQRARTVLARIDHGQTRRAVEVERRFMEALGGGCKVPMGAVCTPAADGWKFHAFLGRLQGGGGFHFHAEVRGDDSAWDSVGQWVQACSEECLARGIVLPRDLPEHELLRGWQMPGTGC